MAEWTEGASGSFAQRKDQGNRLTCKGGPFGCFPDPINGGSCSAKGGHWGRARGWETSQRAGIQEEEGCRE